MTHEIVSVPLTRGQVALVDASDAALVLGLGKWHAQPSRGTFYARRRNGSRIEQLHTVLTGWPLVDHINGDGLDNRRANLRPATAGENAQNKALQRNSTSGFKGVSWHRARGKWSAYITADGRRHSLGYHDDPMAAALAYDAAAKELHGAFARTNLGGVA